jgi:hypothetical protein
MLICYWFLFFLTTGWKIRRGAVQSDQIKCPTTVPEKPDRVEPLVNIKA